MNKLVVTLVVAMTGLAGGTIYLWQQLDAERQLNASLQERVKALEGAQRSLASLFSPRDRPAAAGDATAPQPTAPVDPAELRKQRQQQAEQTMARAREALARPETQQALGGMVRGFLPMMLPDLAKELNLTPAELEKFYDLLGKQTNGVIGQFAAGGAGGQNAAGNLQEMQRNSEAQIASFLGDKYPQWQQYQNTLPTRNQVNQLQNTLAASGNKFTDAQAKTLITALSAEQKRINEDRTTVTQNLSPQERIAQRQQQTAANNGRMVQAASPYMTPAQLDAYKAQLERPGGGMLGGLGGLMGGGMGNRQGGAALPR
jgi:hypothetical protein